MSYSVIDAAIYCPPNCGRRPSLRDSVVRRLQELMPKTRVEIEQTAESVEVARVIADEVARLSSDYPLIARALGNGWISTLAVRRVTADDVGDPQVPSDVLVRVGGVWANDTGTLVINGQRVDPNHNPLRTGLGVHGIPSNPGDLPSAPSVFRHELGHVLLDKLKYNAPTDVSRWTSFCNRNPGLFRMVSFYALANHHDAFAESVAALTHPQYRPGMIPREIEQTVGAILGRSTVATGYSGPTLHIIPTTYSPPNCSGRKSGALAAVKFARDGYVSTEDYRKYLADSGVSSETAQEVDKLLDAHLDSGLQAWAGRELARHWADDTDVGKCLRLVSRLELEAAAVVGANRVQEAADYIQKLNKVRPDLVGGASDELKADAYAMVGVYPKPSTSDLYSEMWRSAYLEAKTRYDDISNDRFGGIMVYRKTRGGGEPDVQSWTLSPTGAHISPITGGPRLSPDVSMKLSEADSRGLVLLSGFARQRTRPGEDEVMFIRRNPEMLAARHSTYNILMIRDAFPAAYCPPNCGARPGRAEDPATLAKEI